MKSLFSMTLTYVMKSKCVTSIVTLFILFISAVYCTTVCEENCHCLVIKNELHIDCSKTNLTFVPRFPTNVSYLNLQNNFIDTLENGAFHNLGNLISLDLTSNKLQIIERNAFVGLENLQRLDLQNNKFSYKNFFPQDVFEPLKSLVYLNVKFENNDLENFPTRLIEALHTLEEIHLDAKYPKPFGREFRKLQRLKTLKIGFCTLNKTDSTTFVNMNHLEYIDLSMCKILKNEYGFGDIKSLQYLKLGNPTFFSTDVDQLANDLITTNIEILVMTNLFRENVLKFPNSAFTSLNSTNIFELHINYNELKEVVRDEDFYTFPTTLRVLDLSNNKIEKFLFDIPYLIQLVLRNNSLGEFLSDQSFTVSSTLKLQHIDLSKNSIYRLKYSLFNDHTHLESINLSRNYLQELSFDLSYQKDLKVLDLSHNYIRRINQTFISRTSKLFLHTNLIIDLSNNVLECSCRTYLTLKWMSENSNQFLHSKTYKCQYNDVRSIVLNDFKEVVQQLEKNCSSHLILIVCVSIVVITLSLMIAVGIFYRYRWKLRYMYYMTRSKYRQHNPVSANTTFTYDAFISYSDHERDFIINECIPNLEHKRKLKLCIHHRDFLPGEEIMVNITNAIHDSRKTICLVTRSFLESYYCMFEFNMARMESIYSRNGENILFLVFYDRLLPEELSLVMLELVQNQSYIEYPNDDQGNVVFWEKIKQAMNG